MLIQPAYRPGPVGVLTLVAALLAPPSAFARQDVPGAADHPMISRYEGAYIIAHHSNAFDAFDIATGPHTSFAQALTEAQTVEGAWTRLLYVAPEGRSTLEVIRNYEATLGALGFELMFTCSGRECGMGPDAPRAGSAIITSALLPRQDMSRTSRAVQYAFTQPRDVRFLSARLSRPEGNIYVSLALAVEAFDQFRLTANRVLILLDVIETSEIEERMVRVEPPLQPVTPSAVPAPLVPDFGTFAQPLSPPVAPGAPPAGTAAPQPSDRVTPGLPAVTDQRPGLAAQLPLEQGIPLALTGDDRAFLEELADQIDELIGEIEERRIAMRARFAGEDLPGEIERAFTREGVSTREWGYIERPIPLILNPDPVGALSHILDPRFVDAIFSEPPDLLPALLSDHEAAMAGIEAVYYGAYVELLATTRDRLENRAAAIARLVNWPDGSPTPLTPAIRAGLRRDIAYLQGGQALWRGEEANLVNDIIPRFRAEMFKAWALYAFFGRENAAEMQAWISAWSWENPNPSIDFQNTRARMCVTGLAYQLPAIVAHARTNYLVRPIYMPVPGGVSHLGSGFQQPYTADPEFDSLLNYLRYAEDCFDTAAPEDIAPLLRLAIALFREEADPVTVDEDGLGPELVVAGYQPVTSIHYGHPVYVEAIFDAAQPREAFSVTLETAFGRVGVLVERSEDDPLLYRSGPVVFAHADGRSAERTP